MSASPPDWSVHLLQLAAGGGLGRAGPRVLLDLPALAQPWTCATRLCTPGRRAPDARSCCADLEVVPTPEERAAIDAAREELTPFLAASDPRWRSAPAIYDGDALARPGRRCVFALPPAGPDTGLSCGLHAFEDAHGRPRGSLKPLPCRLFPLVLVELEDGRTLVTAIAPRTWRLAESRPPRAFACIGAEGAPTVAESSADTLTELFGAKVAAKARAAVAAWAVERG